MFKYAGSDKEEDIFLEWEVKPCSTDKEKEQSVSMVWEQLHVFGVFFVCPVQGAFSCIAAILECSLFVHLCIIQWTMEMQYHFTKKELNVN